MGKSSQSNSADLPCNKYFRKETVNFSVLVSEAVNNTDKRNYCLADTATFKTISGERLCGRKSSRDLCKRLREYVTFNICIFLLSRDRVYRLNLSNINQSSCDVSFTNSFDFVHSNCTNLSPISTELIMFIASFIHYCLLCRCRNADQLDSQMIARLTRNYVSSLRRRGLYLLVS